jgi:hypothetical protein
MEQKGLRTGHFLALVGALVAVASLWRPWYSVRFPPEFRELFSSHGQLGSDPGLFGQLVRGMAAAIPDHVAVSGWDALKGADVTLVVSAVVVLAAVLAASGAIAGVRADGQLAARTASVAGAVVLAVAAWHVVKKPGGGAPAEVADWIHVESGLWMALAAGAAMLGGGLWAGAQLAGEHPYRHPIMPSAAGPLNDAFPPLTPDLPPVFAEAHAGAAGSSVPPPPR